VKPNYIFSDLSSGPTGTLCGGETGGVFQACLVLQDRSTEVCPVRYTGICRQQEEAR